MLVSKLCAIVVDADVMQGLVQAAENADVGATLGQNIRRSAFAAACDARGLKFTATSSGPDPLGTVTVTKDPNCGHERAGRQFTNELLRALDHLGQFRDFRDSGSTRFSFRDRDKEPDASLHYKSKSSTE